MSQTHCPSEKSSYKYRSGQLHWGWVHCLRACRAPRSSRSSCPPNRTQHNSTGNSSRSQPHAVRTRRARHRRSCVDPALRNSFRVLPLTCCNRLNHLDTFRFKLDAPFRAIPNSRGLEEAGVVAPPRKFGFHLFLRTLASVLVMRVDIRTACGFLLHQTLKDDPRNQGKCDLALNESSLIMASRFAQRKGLHGLQTSTMLVKERKAQFG